MCLLSSLDEIDSLVELLAYDVWDNEDDKSGFLDLWVDSFDQLLFRIRPMSLPMVKNSNKNQKYDKWG